ncbi:MAG: TetR/AcrR family transcriptional regulator [Deltaproteobacteria bacterium]|nr:TetR/AcrR family transcriptional regulator [Deltaproteobacteria bacterium]
MRAVRSRPAGRPRPRVRRSHAERSAATRARILAAVVDVIARHGFQGLTAQRIAASSGVTWGAVQHHFGSKDQLLLAVLEDSFTRFAERVERAPLAGRGLAARAALFVDLAWEHFRSRPYRAGFEILLNHLGRAEHRGPGNWRIEMSRAWDRVWSRIFADAKLPRRRSLMLQHFTISTLSGLAATLMLQGAAAELPRAELDVLKATLRRELAARRPDGCATRIG